MIETLVQTYNQTWPILSKGGPIVIILLILSVVAGAIIIGKIVQFARAGNGGNKFVDRTLKQIADGEFESAQAVLDKQRGPIAKIMDAGLDAKRHGALRDQDIEEEVARVGGNELGKLQSYFRWLEVIANVSPLLGLLGTVIGMIAAFQALEIAGNKVDPSILSGGIWEALLTTAVGLSVAIPAVTALNLLENRVDRFRREMRDAAARLIAAMHVGGGGSDEAGLARRSIGNQGKEEVRSVASLAE